MCWLSKLVRVRISLWCICDIANWFRLNFVVLGFIYLIVWWKLDLTQSAKRSIDDSLLTRICENSVRSRSLGSNLVSLAILAYRSTGKGRTRSFPAGVAKWRIAGANRNNWGDRRHSKFIPGFLFLVAFSRYVNSVEPRYPHKFVKSIISISRVLSCKPICSIGVDPRNPLIWVRTSNRSIDMISRRISFLGSWLYWLCLLKLNSCVLCWYLLVVFSIVRFDIARGYWYYR